MLKAKIAGMGSYLPERCVTSEELARDLGLSPGWIERVTGVCERRYVTDETSAGMGANAARQAIQHAGLQASDIDCILWASATPQQAVPCTAVFVQRELGLAEHACPCFDINATCLSFLFALHAAAHFVVLGAYRNILIVSSEISACTRNPNEHESAVLFGDGAGAAILTRAEDNDASCVWHAAFSTDSRGAELTQLRGGGSLHHPNVATTTREDNMFAMRGPAVFKMTARALPPFLDSFFAHVPFDRAALDAVVPHQASLYGLRLLWERLGFREEQVIINLPTRGNCIAASIPLALSEAVHSGRIQRGQRLLLAGTGAGLSIGAIALTY